LEPLNATTGHRLTFLFAYSPLPVTQPDDGHFYLRLKLIWFNKD